MKAGVWRPGKAPVKICRAVKLFLRLLFPSINMDAFPFPPALKGAILYTWECILCSNHSDWVVIFIRKAEQKG